MDNIILIGMPGAGKSTIGVVLAKNMGYGFIDSDLVIQEKEGRILHDIISDIGNDAFIQLENNINSSIEARRCVIATGGSAVYGRDAMEHFKALGKIIYLAHSCAEIRKRLGNLAKRGVAIKEGQTLRDLYNERIPLYEKYADITIDCDKKEIRDIVEEIRARLFY